VALAASHYDAEPRLVQIVHFVAPAETEARPAEPIKLLEVTTAAIPSLTLRPLHFKPSKDFPFAVDLIEVTQDHYDQIQAKTLRLPPTWWAGKEIPKA